MTPLLKLVLQLFSTHFKSKANTMWCEIESEKIGRPDDSALIWVLCKWLRSLRPPSTKWQCCVMLYFSVSRQSKHQKYRNFLFFFKILLSLPSVSCPRMTEHNSRWFSVWFSVFQDAMPEVLQRKQPIKGAPVVLLLKQIQSNIRMVKSYEQNDWSRSLFFCRWNVVFNEIRLKWTLHHENILISRSWLFIHSYIIWVFFLSIPKLYFCNVWYHLAW